VATWRICRYLLTGVADKNQMKGETRMVKFKIEIVFLINLVLAWLSGIVIYPWLRLLKLDLSLLLNMRTKAFRRAGVLLSLPLTATMLIFMVMVVVSDLSMILFPRRPGSSLKPWMVKYQFSLLYNKKLLTSDSDRCKLGVESYNRSINS
jgi:hypothetical protein